MRIFFLLFILSGMVACASKTVQSDQVLKNAPAELPRQAEVPRVPFYQQQENHCGPASLAMVLNWAGSSATPESIARNVMTPHAKGSFQADMISAARREGYVAIPIRGLPALMSEVAEGHPVIVFENLALSWLPQWHYAVVYGYDLDAEKVSMHSGPEEAKRWDLRKFERSWKLADYWGLVVLPAGRISKSAPELEQVQAAAALEKLGFLTEARKTYMALLRRWPQSYAASMGLGNVSFAQGRFEESASAFKRATVLRAHSASAWHNLSLAQLEVQKTLEAQVSARRALKLASEKEKARFEASLEKVLASM